MKNLFRKDFKRCTSIFLAVCMILTGLPFTTVSAEETLNASESISVNDTSDLQESKEEKDRDSGEEEEQEDQDDLENEEIETNGFGETPYQRYGDIQVAEIPDTGCHQICDSNGDPIQLKGMSTFGLQWGDGDWVLNENAFDALAYDWHCDVIRLAMYVTEDGYKDYPAEILAKVEKGIELATERGMYVIVDWHVLSPGDPTNEMYLSAGEELVKTNSAFAAIKSEHPEYRGPQLFFAYLSQKYGMQGNVLFETANEPNGLGSEEDAGEVWNDKLLPYHQSVVDAIRNYDADKNANIVICGTDNWSQFVDAPSDNPVKDPFVEKGQEVGDQIMYTFHFYAGTHDTISNEDGTYWLESKVENALNNKLAVICTEWGTSEATGDGGPYINNSLRWLEFLNKNQISWCSWSLAKKNEISASMLSSTPSEPTDHNGDGIPDWSMDELSITGNFIRAMIQGENPPIYEKSKTVLDFEDGNVFAVMNEDSPIKDYDMSVEDFSGNKLLKLSKFPKSPWDLRISFNDLGCLYSIYKDLSFDVYIPEGCDYSNTIIEILPVLQSNGLSWWDPLNDYYLTGNEFSMDEETGLMKATVRVPLRNVPAGDKLGHIMLMFGTSDDNEGLYIDNIGFHTSYNGDVSEEPVVPDEPGSFVSLPFTFEMNQREGWKKDGDSAVDYQTIAIEEVGENNNALSFPVKFVEGKNDWEDGARLTSPFNIFDYDDCLLYDALAMNVYLEANKATSGEIQMDVCSIPNGDGYWYQSGEILFDPTKGEAVTTPDGRDLLKYYVYVPLNNNPESYGEYPFSENTPIRNIILALHNDDSDYEGRVYYDNIRFVDADNLDDIDKEINLKYHNDIINPPDPGTPDPETPDPGTPDPGDDPSVSGNDPDPGTPDPGTPDPGTPDPGKPDPGKPDPGKTDPGTPDPGKTDPGKPDPTTPTPDKPAPSVSGNDEPAITPLVKGSIHTVGKGKYKVVSNKTDGNGTVQFVSPTSKKYKSFSIPKTVKINNVSYKVTSIASKAFYYNSKLKKVSIGENITTIGSMAFYKCKSLTSISISEKVTSIGTKAFYKCTSLTSIIIPEKVKSIGSKAYYGCKKLKTITIKTTKLTTKNVGSKAFKGIVDKAKIKVPNSKLKSYKKLLIAKGVSKKAEITKIVTKKAPTKKTPTKKTPAKK